MNAITIINNSSLLLYVDGSPPTYSWHTGNPNMPHMTSNNRVWRWRKMHCLVCWMKG